MRSLRHGTKLRDGEHVESGIRRFKRDTEKSGVLSECRKREHYVKPSVAKKQKSKMARKRKLKEKK